MPTSKRKYHRCLHCGKFRHTTGVHPGCRVAYNIKLFRRKFHILTPVQKSLILEELKKYMEEI